MILPVVICVEKRTDQHHAGAGSPYQIGKHGSQGKHAHVCDGRANQVAGQPDPSGNNKKRAEKNNKRQVMLKSANEKMRIMNKTNVDDGNRKKSRDQHLILERMPESVRCKRQNSNR